jgi:hypothetical protein
VVVVVLVEVVIAESVAQAVAVMVQRGLLLVVMEQLIQAAVVVGVALVALHQATVALA